MADVPDSLAAGDDIPLSTYDGSGLSVLPNYSLSNLDLPGQLDNFPGGIGANSAYPGGAADPSGMNSLYLDPGVNPSPTGGYLNVLASVANAAASGFSTFAKGSPSVATPRPLLPGGSITSSQLTGKTNWLVIGIIVIAGVVALGWIAKSA
jgi:hypothetical protein